MSIREAPRLKIVLLLPILLVNVYLSLCAMGEVLPIDLTTYGYMAHEMIAGERLYSHLWDHKPPGVYLLFLVSELVWGYGPVGVVYLGVIFNALSLVFLFLFLRRIAGIKAGLMGAAFWSLSSNSVYLEANLPNVELFINTFTILSLWAFAIYYDNAERRWPLLLSGLALGAASVFKMVAVFPFFALMLYTALYRPPGDLSGSRGGSAARRLLSLLIPCAVVWSAIFIYFAAFSDFAAFFDTVFLYNTRYSGGIFANLLKFFLTPSLLFHLALKEVLVLVTFSFAWVCFSRKCYGPLSRPLLVFFLVAIIVEIASPGKYYFHYYQLLLPMICILPALFISDLAGFVERRGGSSSVKTVVVAVIVASTIAVLSYYQWGYIARGPEGNSIKKYETEYLEVREVAEYIKSITEPCERVYSWGEETGIYYYSQRSAPSGIFFIYALFFESPEEREAKLSRLYRDLSEREPSIFVLEGRWAAKMNRPIRGLLKERYRYLRSYGDYTLYVLKDRERPDCNGA